MGEINVLAERKSRGRRGVRISVVATVVTIVVAGVLTIFVESRGFASARAAVRASCHPAKIVGVGPLGVEWEPSANDPGTGYIASIGHEFGVRYVVKDCKAKGFTHG